MPLSPPSYIKAYDDGRLKDRLETAMAALSSCTLCPRSCSANRLKGEKGVCNTSGYDRVETLKLLDGIVDIYMPDAKFFDAVIAEKTCGAPDCPLVLKKALKEMHRQVGDLHINTSNIAERGLLVRHLVLPEHLATTDDIMTYIATHLSNNTYVNIMSKYRPCKKASQIEKLSRKISEKEYLEALQIAEKAGILRLDAQVANSCCYIEILRDDDHISR